MYRTILVPLENGPADATIIAHVSVLAARMDSKLVLLHVADGWAARNFKELELQESEEMQADRLYLQNVEKELRQKGLCVGAILAAGSPPEEIIRVSREQQVDLIAMATHGHRFLGDVLHGATVTRVRHEVDVPVLLLKAKSS